MKMEVEMEVEKTTADRINEQIATVWSIYLNAHAVVGDENRFEVEVTPLDVRVMAMRAMEIAEMMEAKYGAD